MVDTHSKLACEGCPNWGGMLGVRKDRGPFGSMAVVEGFRIRV